MKKLKFADHLIGLVLDGKKDTTWRVNDDKGISVGDELALCRKDGSEFARARVTHSSDTTFENVGKEDKEGHEKFSSEKEMYRTYSRYYGMEVTPKTKVKVIKFRLL